LPYTTGQSSVIVIELQHVYKRPSTLTLFNDKNDLIRLLISPIDCICHQALLFRLFYKPGSN